MIMIHDSAFTSDFINIWVKNSNLSLEEGNGNNKKVGSKKKHPPALLFKKIRTRNISFFYLALYAGVVTVLLSLAEVEQQAGLHS